MSKDVNSFFDSEARALEREARTAKAEIEQLAQQLAALPADARATIRGRIDSNRRRLEAIATQAERALDDQRADVAAKLARLERQLEGQVDELERRRIEASQAEAEAAHEASRHALENARSFAKDAVDLSVESLGRHSRALDTSS